MRQGDQTIAGCGPIEDLQQLHLRLVDGPEHYVLDWPGIWMIFPIALGISAAACAATAWSCRALAVAEWASLKLVVCMRKSAKRIHGVTIQRRITFVAGSASVNQSVANSDLNLGIRSKVVVDALRHTGEISSTKAISVRRPPASERGQVGRLHPLDGKTSGRSCRPSPDRQCYGPGCRAKAQDGQRSQRRFDSAIIVNTALRRIGMASRVDTATRHKREQCCYSFMHIVWPRRSVPLIGGHSSHTFLRKRRGEVLEKVKKFRNTDFSGFSPAELHSARAITADKMSALRGFLVVV